jgi:hypothetical protein
MNDPDYYAMLPVTQVNFFVALSLKPSVGAMTIRRTTFSIITSDIIWHNITQDIDTYHNKSLLNEHNYSQHYDIWLNDTKQNDIFHNGTQHNL